MKTSNLLLLSALFLSSCGPQGKLFFPDKSASKNITKDDSPAGGSDSSRPISIDDGADPITEGPTGGTTGGMTNGDSAGDGGSVPGNISDGGGSTTGGTSGGTSDGGGSTTGGTSGGDDDGVVIIIPKLPASFPENIFLVRPGDPVGLCKDGSNRYELTLEKLLLDESYRVSYNNIRNLTKKNCSSKRFKNRYLGPWDGQLYEEGIMVWIDHNKNGIADCGEIITLEQAKIAALNACEVIQQREKDNKGASSENRSPILKFKETLPNEVEILNQLSTGKTLKGEKADFRWAYDLDLSPARPLGARSTK
jgi:hypothetical protein